jgi:hypothetical protein
MFIKWYYFNVHYNELYLHAQLLLFTITYDADFKAIWLHWFLTR